MPGGQGSLSVSVCPIGLQSTPLNLEKENARKELEDDVLIVVPLASSVSSSCRIYVEDNDDPQCPPECHFEKVLVKDKERSASCADWFDPNGASSTPGEFCDRCVGGRSSSSEGVFETKEEIPLLVNSLRGGGTSVF